jgi:hypothetical protein
MVLRAVEQVYICIGGRQKDQDLARLCPKDLRRRLTRSEKKSVKMSVSSMRLRARLLEEATNLIESAEFKGYFARESVQALRQLAPLLSRVSDHHALRLITSTISFRCPHINPFLKVILIHLTPAD